MPGLRSVLRYAVHLLHVLDSRGSAHAVPLFTLHTVYAYYVCLHYVPYLVTVTFTPLRFGLVRCSAFRCYYTFPGYLTHGCHTRYALRAFMPAAVTVAFHTLRTFGSPTGWLRRYLPQFPTHLRLRTAVTHLPTRLQVLLHTTVYRCWLPATCHAGLLFTRSVRVYYGLDSAARYTLAHLRSGLVRTPVATQFRLTQLGLVLLHTRLPDLFYLPVTAHLLLPHIVRVTFLHLVLRFTFTATCVPHTTLHRLVLPVLCRFILPLRLFCLPVWLLRLPHCGCDTYGWFAHTLLWLRLFCCLRFLPAVGCTVCSTRSYALVTTHTHRFYTWLPAGYHIPVVATALPLFYHPAFDWFLHTALQFSFTHVTCVPHFTCGYTVGLHILRVRGYRILRTYRSAVAVGSSSTILRSAFTLRLRLPHCWIVTTGLRSYVLRFPRLHGCSRLLRLVLLPGYGSRWIRSTFPGCYGWLFTFCVACVYGYAVAFVCGWLLRCYIYGSLVVGYRGLHCADYRVPACYCHAVTHYRLVAVTVARVCGCLPACTRLLPHTARAVRFTRFAVLTHVRFVARCAITVLPAVHGSAGCCGPTLRLPVPCRYYHVWIHIQFLLPPFTWILPTRIRCIRTHCSSTVVLTGYLVPGCSCRYLRYFRGYCRLRAFSVRVVRTPVTTTRCYAGSTYRIGCGWLRLFTAGYGLRSTGLCRVLHLRYGWFVYHVPQLPHRVHVHVRFTPRLCGYIPPRSVVTCCGYRVPAPTTFFTAFGYLPRFVTTRVALRLPHLATRTVTHAVILRFRLPFAARLLPAAVRLQFTHRFTVLCIYGYAVRTRVCRFCRFVHV